MFARLTALVGSSSSLSFELGEAKEGCWGIWTHYHGTWRADQSPVSVFRTASTSKLDAKLAAARNGIKRLRMLRHPDILAFKDTAEAEEKGESVLYLVTERMALLPVFLEGADAAEREAWVSLGLQRVLSALSFLNRDCSLIHGRVCMDSIAVTEQGDWKLAALELVTEAGGGPDPLQAPLRAASWLTPQAHQPGELAKGDWEAVWASPPHAVDAWGVGCLMRELFGGDHARAGEPLRSVEQLRDTSRIPQHLLQPYQRLLASAPARRLAPAALLAAGTLATPLSEAAAFLENLSVKEGAEKDAFFKKLPRVMEEAPPRVAQKKVLPLLAKGLEFGGAPPSALVALLRLASSMREEARAAALLPVLVRLFGSNDRALRRALLENVELYGPDLPAELVEKRVYADVATGFQDGNPYLRELTLKAMAVLAPKLSQKLLSQDLLKHLARLQVDEEASIRANTTVLLGVVAPHLGAATCRKVLLNAFGRAARDAFPPARAAAMRAMLATASLHAPEELATRAIPAASPLCADPVPEVRAAALEALQSLVRLAAERVRELNQAAADAAAAAEKAAPGGGGGGGGSLASAPAGAGGQGAGGALLSSLGWAVSGLGIGGRKESAADVRAAPGASSSKDPAPRGAGSPRGGVPVSAPALRPRPASAASWKDALAEEEEEPGSGWDDAGGLDALEAELEARARLGSQRAAGAPAPAAASPGRAPAPPTRRTGLGAKPLGAQRAGARAKGGSLKLGAHKAAPDVSFDEW